MTDKVERLNEIKDDETVWTYRENKIKKLTKSHESAQYVPAFQKKSEGMSSVRWKARTLRLVSAFHKGDQRRMLTLSQINAGNIHR